MNKLIKVILFFQALFICSEFQTFAQDSRQILFNSNWKFNLGDVIGAENPEYNDSRWRELNLPHDWSIEGKFSADNASGTGYLPGGIGWYRKDFYLSQSESDKRIVILFDGAYENSEVWVNGHLVGKRPFGFIAFYYDISDYVKFGDAANIIAVRLDNSQVADSRWYTGSGIFRSVWLIKTNNIYLNHWGTYITTPTVTKESADVCVVTEVKNETDNEEVITLKSIVLDAVGKEIANISSDMVFQPQTTYRFDQTIGVANPSLWGIENPNLYSLVSEVYIREKIVDKTITKFGIRTFNFDAGKGFTLNGKLLKIKGVCLHNDAGSIGSAVPKREWERRLVLMKEMGANAVRTSHNPPAPELLELCDEMGFMVMDEAFDEWVIGKKKWIHGRNVGMDLGAAGVGEYYSQHGYSDFFKEWAKQDIQDMVKRDRNHPSIILWSIGNEIDYPNDPYTDPSHKNYEPWRPQAYQLTEIARDLSDYIKEVDKTRPVTAAVANIPLSNRAGYCSVLDVVGYNYQEQYYEEDHKKFPYRKMLGSENGDSYEAWMSVKNNDYMPGQFLWTGVDYIGEAGEFPSRSNLAGLVDLSDYRKPGFYYRKSLWTDKPMVYIATISPVVKGRRPLEENWNWEEYDGKEITVMAFTNCEKVSLLLNNKLISSKEMTDTNKAVLIWKVPYSKGELKAVAYIGDSKEAEYILKTTGKPAQVVLESDLDEITANGKDFASVKVLVTDSDGNVVPNADNEIEIKVTGAGSNIGFGNGDSRNVDLYKDNKHMVYQGKARVFIQSNGGKGYITVEAVSKGLSSSKIKIKTK